MALLAAIIRMVSGNRYAPTRRARQAIAVACCALVAANATVSRGQAPVLPPPGSGLPAPQSSNLLFDPPPDLLSETDVPTGLLEETFAEAIAAGEIVPDRVPLWYEPAYWFGFEPWDAGIEFGLNGSEGEKQALSLQSGGHIKRNTKRWKLDSSITYNKNTANGVETQHNGLVDLRVDRRMQDSPWSLYMIHQTLYDEFQAYDLRISINSGLGYQLVDTEYVELIGRFGAGTSREFGGPDNQWAPEALWGLDYEHAISPTQRVSAKVDYYPEWDNFNAYRVVSDMGWEIDLDQPQHLSLKISVVDRYDSTPNGVEPNLLNYAVLLIWSL